MFALKVNFFLFRTTSVTTESLLFTLVKYYNRKIDTVSKRGSMLVEFITNKDKRNKWHFNIQSDKPKARTFEKVHKPHRRKAVLNSLFIKNITDVISTGDIIPEISKYTVEITAVKISPCNKILNVFWQVPVNQFDSCEDITKLLTLAAPKIRAELISRNVLGRVPFIYFLRDATNERISAFEKAMRNLDLGPECESNIVVDDSFVEDIFSFKSAKGKMDKAEVLSDDMKELTDSNKDDAKEECNVLPEKPADMKCNIFGLDHDVMMGKVIGLKKKKKGPAERTALISLDNLKDDLFDKIPGIRFVADSTPSSRDDILKRFHVERKILMQKKKERSCDDVHHQGDVDDDSVRDAEYDTYEEDFIDDETTDNPR